MKSEEEQEKSGEMADLTASISRSPLHAVRSKRRDSDKTQLEESSTLEKKKGPSCKSGQQSRSGMGGRLQTITVCDNEKGACSREENMCEWSAREDPTEAETPVE